MKKLLTIVVLSIVTVGLKADWQDSLNSIMQSPTARDIANAANKYIPANLQQQASTIATQVAPIAAPYAAQAASAAGSMLQRLPEDQRNKAAALAQNIVQQAAAVTQAKMEGNPQMVNAAQNVLDTHTAQLNTLASSLPFADFNRFQANIRAKIDQAQKAVKAGQ